MMIILALLPFAPIHSPSLAVRLSALFPHRFATFVLFVRVFAYFEHILAYFCSLKIYDLI